MKKERGKLHWTEVVASASSELLENADASVKPRVFHFAPLYSGGPLYVDGWNGATYVDLKTLKIDPAPKALVEHDWEMVVGKLDNIEIRNEGGLLSLYCDAIVGGSKLAAKVVEALAVADWVSSIGVYRLDDDKIEMLKEGEKTIEIDLTR